MTTFIRIFGCITLLLLAISSTAAQSPDHFYLELKNIDTTYTVGKIVKINDDYQNIESDTIDLDGFIKNITDSYSENYQDKPGLFIYIHGMNAHHRRFQRIFNNTMSPKFYEREGFHSKVVLSLVWHAAFDYEKNVEKAIVSGNRFAHVLDTLYRALIEVNPKMELDILCHSMGNRCYQGIHSTLDSLESPLQFDNVVFAAADLPIDIFCEDQALANIYDRSRMSYITRNNRDMTLGASKYLNEADRLGLGGPVDIADKDYLKVIDCSLLRDNETLYFNFENHKYHYGSPTGREALFQLMIKNQFDLKFTQLDTLDNWMILEEIEE